MPMCLYPPGGGPGGWGGEKSWWREGWERWWGLSGDHLVEVGVIQTQVLQVVITVNGNLVMVLGLSGSQLKQPWLEIDVLSWRPKVSRYGAPPCCQCDTCIHGVDSRLRCLSHSIISIITQHYQHHHTACSSGHPSPSIATSWCIAAPQVIHHHHMPHHGALC